MTPATCRQIAAACVVVMATLPLAGCGATHRSAPRASGVGPPSAVSATPVDSALVPSAPPVATLRWQARSENGVYGYLVFRADREQGPFLRISESIIPIAGDAAELGTYSFIDHDVEPGRTYYYSLDVVKDNGRKNRFSGVMSKKVAP